MTPPVIGAALGTADLETHRDWILEKQRDLELQSFHAPDVLGGDWQPEADRINALLDGYTGRLGIHGPFWGFTLHSIDPDVRAVVTKRVNQGLDVCRAVGATQMVLHSPYTTWDYNNLDNLENARDRVIENTHATLSAAVKRAEDQGVTLVIENIEDIAPLDRRRLVESFNSSAVRLSIDTGHAHYAHGTNGAPPVDYYVGAAAGLLDHIHLQDADGYADRHWAIGEGTICWHAVFRALAKLEEKPRLIMELRDKAGIPASIDYLTHEGLGQ
ncbi:sugar phosphate isomerase/epimerase [Rhodobacteraceae bacterium D3-12]|nr:sugar phosphate isomerase/epimerase [Rhodobacteraceae bacterium D3-12]